jgi:hypothetical protein
MTLPSTAYRGYAAPTWDTKTIQQLIDYLTSTFNLSALDARYATPAAVSARAGGVVGWKFGSPAVATTSEAQVMTTGADLTAGRMYECSLMNITPDQGNTKATEFRLRYTTDGSAPSNASAMLAISLRLSQFELGAIRIVYVAPANQRLNLRASIGSLDGQNVRSWCPGNGAALTIYDMGVAPGQVGSAP